MTEVSEDQDPGYNGTNYFIATWAFYSLNESWTQPTFILMCMCKRCTLDHIDHMPKAWIKEKHEQEQKHHDPRNRRVHHE